MDEYQPTPIARYVWCVLKDGTAFRGALVGNSLDVPFIELRGAQIAEHREGLADVYWRAVDWPVIIYRSTINYLFDTTPQE